MKKSYLLPIFFLLMTTLHGEEKTYEFSCEENYTLHIENCIGEITLKQVEGTKGEITFSLPEKVEIEAVLDSDDLSFSVKLPEESVLPLKKRKKRLSYTYRGKTYSCNESSRDDLYVKITAKVPAQGSFDITNGFGKIDIAKIQGAYSFCGEESEGVIKDIKGNGAFQIGEGDISFERCKGALFLQNGSGKVHISDSEIALKAVLGSCKTSLNNVVLQKGSIKIGSGALLLSGCSGDGDIISGTARIALDDHSRCKRLLIHSGSAPIRLKGDFSELEQLELVSASGGITFSSYPFPEMSLECFSASGNIIDNVCSKKKKREGHFFEKDFGVNGKGTIYSASGDIRLESKQKRKSSHSREE